MTVPVTLAALRIWMTWAIRVKPDGEKFKMPLYAKGRPGDWAGSSTDPGRWVTYPDAREALDRHPEWAGLAFALADDVWVVDLDHCVTDDGDIEGWAVSIIKRLDSYAEISPSGTGVHIILRGDRSQGIGLKYTLPNQEQVPEGEKRRIEMYQTAHYFTFTGETFEGSRDDLMDRTEAFMALRVDVESKRAASHAKDSVPRSVTKAATAAKAGIGASTLTDEQVLALARSSKAGEVFEALMDGETENYANDHSSADMALCGHLTFWTRCDPEQMDRIFRTSKLMRPKWDTRRGLETYGEKTIQLAIDNCTEVYEGGDRATENFKERNRARRSAKAKGAISPVRELSNQIAHEIDRSILTQDAQETAKLITQLNLTAGLSRQTIQDSLVDGKPIPLITKDLTDAMQRLSQPVDMDAAGNMHPWPPDDPRRSTKSTKSTKSINSTNATNTTNAPEEGRDEPVDGTVQRESQPSVEGDGRENASQSDSASDRKAPLRSSSGVIEIHTVSPNETTPPEDAKYPETDDIGNADRLVTRYTGKLLWSPGTGWMYWDGRRWAIGDQYAHLAGQETARSIMQEAVDPRLDLDHQKALFGHYRKSAALGSRNAMITTATVRPEFYIEQKLLDAQDMFLNVLNGTLNLETGELMTHDPEHRITKLAPVHWNPDARSALWEEFLEKATQGQEGLADFLQRAVGYTLTGQTVDDVFFVVKGNAGTGKTTFTNSILNMMGDYGTTMSSEVITDRMGGRGGHSEEVAVLAGRRLVLSSETNASDSIKEGLVKGLTGQEEISASKKYGHQVTFRPQFKLWLAANDMPKVRADDTGLWRRVHKLTFDHVFSPADKRVRRTLLYDPHHREGILAWAVQGTRLWLADGLRPPQSVIEATEQLRQSTDRLAEFFEDVCYFNINPEARLWTDSATLAKAYWDWANENNVPEKFRPSPRGDLYRNALTHRGAVARKHNGVRGWSGVIVKDLSEQI